MSVANRIRIADKARDTFRKRIRDVYDEYLDDFRKMSKQVHNFHYDQKHNVTLSKSGLKSVMSKAGVYVGNLGAMVFMQ